MRRRLGMGDSQTINLFEQGLSSYKKSLIDLYRKKTLLISQRETFRFQYLAAYKAKLEAVRGDIYSRLHQLDDPDLTSATSTIMGGVKKSIPMATLAGVRVDGYGALPFSIGGRFQLSMLAPIDQIISLAFHTADNPDQRPAYKLYNFDIDVERDFTGYWLIWPHQMKQFPPTQEWFDALIDQYSQGNPSIKAKFPQAVQLLSADWPSGNMVSILNEMKSTLDKIISKTKEIIRVQQQIDTIESDLAQFILEYQDYAGSSSNISDVLMQIKAASEQADQVVPVEAPQGSLVVTDAPQISEGLVEPAGDLIVPDIIQSEAPAQKSNTMVYAAVAAGLLFLFKGR